jgi:Derlin-2/3
LSPDDLRYGGYLQAFFLGSSGLSYIFDLVMLYRTSNGLETSDFLYRSADYAWQLILASLAVLSLNVPLKSFVHARAFLMLIAYLHSKLSPPGAQTSLMGLVSIPYAYFPYVLAGMDLIMAGPKAAAQAVTGMIVGHLWWWGIFETRSFEALGTAPGWLRGLIGGPEGGSSASGGRGGVHVIPPRARQQSAATGSSSGHNWGSGNRLGSE